MKKYLYLLGSFVSLAMILQMWLIADGRTFSKSRFSWDNPCSVLIGEPQPYTISQENVSYQSWYGIGQTVNINTETRFYYLKKDIKFRWFKTKSFGSYYSSSYPWWKNILPALRLGWLLVLLTFVQYMLLIRRKKKKTAAIASPVLQQVEEKREEPQKRYLRFKPRKKPPYRFFYYALYSQMALAVAIFLADYGCVFISKKMKFFVFTDGYQFDSAALNIEYFLPSTVYLIATLISALCLHRFVKKRKSENDYLTIENQGDR